MRLRWFGPAVLVFALYAEAGFAASFSFTGTFTQDDQSVIFLFTAPTASTVVETWSYAGGVNAAGDPISAGGFDPVLSVFDAAGGLIASSVLEATNDDGAGVAIDPSTGAAFDSLIFLTGLDPGGEYALVLTESDNLPIGPTYGDGFTQTGQGNFTAVEFPCGGSAFCDANLDLRTGSWAVDIVNVGTAGENGAIPEPASISLAAMGIALLVAFRRRKSA